MAEVNEIIVTEEEFAQMVEDYEGLFVCCPYVDDDGFPCKYHERYGGKTYTLNKAMILSLLSSDDVKEVSGNCDRCKTPFKFVIK